MLVLSKPLFLDEFICIYCYLMLGRSVGLADTSLGEHEIIRLMQKLLTIMPNMPVPFGDDVSAVPIGIEGEVAVLKTDMLVGATDMPPGMSLFQTARKAIVMNISDFASKGVLPSAVQVALGIPKKYAKKKYIVEIGEGLNAGAREYGCYVVGGDTGEASDLIISISLFGTAKQNNLILRKGTRAADILAVTGMFGKTAAGLRILMDNFSASGDVRQVLVDSVFNPKARLREGLALRGSGAVTASMDSSDGLAWCLHELSRKNRVGFCIDNLPIAAEVKEFAAQNHLNAADLALYGGEEYELVLTVKPGKWVEASELVKSVGGCLIPIGKATYDKRVVYEVAGEKHAIAARGYEHFKTPP
jgi:thiamine-monophosphate kinase